MLNLLSIVWVFLVCLVSTALAPELGLYWWLGYVFGINIATFGLYAIDKFLAGKAFSRVPELYLHLAALAGGTPMAYLAQQSLRHKTVKASFRRVFWLTVGLQVLAIIGLLVYWLTSDS
ncbi:MAG: DUF1294 domain-containing protein [Opitutales bacterium]